MNQIITRPATLNDLEILLQFEQGIIEAERPFDSTLKEEAITYYDLKELIESPGSELVVAQLCDEIIGSGYALIKAAKPFLKHGRYAYLGFMYVKPAWRGKGVNQQIIDALKQWAISKKITELRLQVYADNLTAKRAYEKVGFTGHMLEMRMEL